MAAPIQLPPQYEAQTFAAFVARFIGQLPTIAIDLAHRASADCTPTEIGPGVDLITQMEQAGLIQFATNRHTGDPAIFIAARHHFIDPVWLAAANRIVSYFDTTGEFDAASGQFVSTPPPVSEYLTRVETPDGFVPVMRLVADRLLDKQLLMRATDGTIRGPSRQQVYDWVAEFGVCDFCSAPSAPHVLIVPDFDMPSGVGRSTNGWAACDACAAFVKANKRADLLRRSVDQAAHGKFTSAAIQALHRLFWQAHDELGESAGIAAALREFIEDTAFKPTQKLHKRERRLEAIRVLTGMTTDEVDALAKGDLVYKEVSRKLVAWRKQYLKNGDYEGAKKLAALMEQGQRPPLPPGHVPHWQAALDARFDALRTMVHVMNVEQPFHQAEAVDLHDDANIQAVLKKAQLAQTLRDLEYDVDLRMLQTAETYSFNQDTITAIREAAKSIPHDSPLSSIETPNIGAGWFWFSPPLDLVTSPAASNKTYALLWGWDTDSNDKPVMRFSAYVMDEQSGPLRGKMLPSTKWHWPLEMSFHEMLAYAVAKYRMNYGPGGPYEGNDNLIGEKATLDAVADLSLFFLAACMWFKQKILVATPGHIERHARKRYVREHKLKEPPEVRVIALRAAYREPASSEVPAVHGSREYHWRWIVRGHARLQACGPGRADRKLIWIDPYPKGPEDKPLKTKEKVYAVIR